ncbi:MAG: hypothetical protein K2W97_00485 [Chthoniobacterales bacterium]|nr:hypothetical protein [Chthoniobacterales bacterium]
MNNETISTDNAKVVTHANLRLSWVWLFPVLALLAVGWFFLKEWKSRGPEVQIEFYEAPGIEANKTLLFYRGVAAGKVIDVRLDQKLNRAIVTVRLKAFAAPLAQSGTLYWIDQPVIGLAKTSGLSSIIQGNSIQARLGEGSISSYFVGLEKAPLHPLQAPGLVLKLAADEIPSLEEGSPIIYRGITIGGVMRKEFDAGGNPYVIVGIQKQFVNLITTNSRFWNGSSSMLKIGPAGIRFELFDLKSLFIGSIEVDAFGPAGESVDNGMIFRLCANESEARFEDSGMTISLVAKEIPTIEVGAPVLYHGVIVGKVRKKNLTENGGAVLTLFIKKEFVPTMGRNVRFWRLPATEIQAGSGVLKVAIASFKTLLEGGIAYDLMGPAGAPVGEGATFSLFPNEELARMSSSPLHFSFENGQGLVAGRTQLRYRGLPVGIVEEVKIFPKNVEVTAYLKTEYDFLRQPGINYKIVHSKLSLDGATSLETLLSGVYIECVPAKKPRPVVKLIDRLFKPKK